MTTTLTYPPRAPLCFGDNDTHRPPCAYSRVHLVIGEVPPLPDSDVGRPLEFTCSACTPGYIVPSSPAFPRASRRPAQVDRSIACVEVV